MATLTSLPSKLVRAVRWYLIKNGVDGSSCYHAFDNRLRNFNDNRIVVDVQIVPMGAEPVFSGDDDFIIEVQVKAQMADQTSDTNAETGRLALDKQIGAIRELLMVSDDGGQSLVATAKAVNTAAYTMSTDPDIGANNADMDDFTVLQWVNDIYGRAKSQEVNTAVVQRFRAKACESKIVGYV